MKEFNLSNQSLETLFWIMVKVKCNSQQEIRNMAELFDVLEEPVVVFEDKVQSMQSQWNELMADSAKTELKKEVRDEAKAKAEEIWEQYKEVHKCRVNILLNQNNIETISKVIDKATEMWEVSWVKTIRNLREIIEYVCIA